MARLLYVAEFLRQLRYGETVAGIRRELSARMGDEWCERTVYRDLQVLEELGFAHRDQARNRWLWVNRSASLVECRPEAVAC